MGILRPGWKRLKLCVDDTAAPTRGPHISPLEAHLEDKRSLSLTA